MGELLPFGIEPLDGRLADGGLSLSALHEVAAASPALADDAAATLFIAGVAARCVAQVGEGTVLWALTSFDLYAPGLEQVGLTPGRVLYAQARKDSDVLALIEDALRHGTLAAVIGEVRSLTQTDTRRLQLAASEGQTPALLYRRWRTRNLSSGTSPLADNSFAATRWRIGSAPSEPLDIPGVGRGRWTIECVRQRSGSPFALIAEACDAEGRLGRAAAAGDRAATPSASVQAA